MVTKEEFLAYYRVQRKGDYNMLDTRARRATGLKKEVYFDIIEHYDEYYDKYIRNV